MIHPEFAEPDFKALFESAPGLYIVLDRDLRIVAATGAYLEATLTRRAEILGRYIFDVFPDNPEDPSADAVRNSGASFRRVLESGVSDVMDLQRHDVRKPQSEGGGWEERYWRAVNSPVFHADGSVAYILHRVDNVTEMVDLRRREKEQRRQREFLETLLAHAPYGIAVHRGRELRYLLANPAYQAMTGGVELIGRTYLEVFPEAAAAGIQAKFQQVIETGEPWVVRRYKVSLPGKPDATFEGQAVRLPSAPGDEPAILAFAWDVTGQAAAEEALRESEEQFRTLANAIPQLCSMANADGWIFWFNERWYEYTGTTPEQMAGWGWQSVHDPAALPQVLERWKASLATGRPFDMVFPLRGAEGIFRPFLTRIMPVRGRDGKVARWIGTNTDISEQRQAEEALRESEQRYRSLFANSLDAVFLTVGDGRIEAANPAACEMFGMTEQEICTLGREGLLDPHDRRLGPALEARRLTGHAQGELTFIRKDGSTFEGDVSSVMVGDKGQAFVIVRDITERKRAERQLAESERRFSLMFEKAAFGISLSSIPEGVLADVNEAWAKIFGYTRQEAIGKTLLELNIYPNAEYRAGLIAEFEDCGYAGDREITLRAKSGRELVVSANFDQLEIAGQTYVLSSFRDITDHRRSEQALRESEARFRALIENSHDSIHFLDENGAILYRSPSCRRLIGFTDEERVGSNFLDAMHPDDRPAFRRAWNDLIQDPETAREVFFRVRHRDGTWKSVETSIQNLMDNPHVGAFIATSRDVTERKRAEAELTQANLRLNLAVTSGRLGVWEWDILSNTLVWDDHMFELYGVARGGFTGDFEAWRNCVHPDDRAAAVAGVEAALRDERRYDLEFRVVHPGGAVRHMRADGLVVRDANGRAVRMIGMNRDVTEARQSEEERERLQMQLFQAQKMESVGRLAGGVAHDFNNLLTVINGYSKMALADLAPGDPLQDSLSEIHKAGERATALTRQLLAFSRKQVLQPRVLDLQRVLVDMQSMLRRMVCEEVELRLELSGKNVLVYADLSQLEQVIMNLVVNARDAMPDGGRLLLETALVERDESYARSHPEARAGRYAMLGVTDTGVGMDEATRLRIFEPFFTTKGTGRGTGLGLSMVQGIVSQSAGYVDVESQPGRGSTFQIYLPALSGAAAEMEKPAALSELRGNETILVVEDQVEVRAFTAAALKAYGYRVIPASGGSEALAIWQRENARIDLVLTDVVMPHMSGRELVVRLAALCPGIKALYMSGYTGSVIAQHGILEEDTPFIQKPFSPEELAGKVRAVLGTAGAT